MRFCAVEIPMRLMFGQWIASNIAVASSWPYENENYGRFFKRRVHTGSTSNQTYFMVSGAGRLNAHSTHKSKHMTYQSAATTAR